MPPMNGIPFKEEKNMNYDPITVAQEALKAANAAGHEWMKNASPKYRVFNADLFTGEPKGESIGEMLDLCGNAHLQFKDARTADYKAFLKAGLVRRTGNKVVEIPHMWKRRQEHGLQMACIAAEVKVFHKYGITNIRIWDYID
jgi:hypothetical protein